MKLVELDSEWNPIINPELFLIECFEELRIDRQKDKDLLIKEIGYIYFFYNLKSDFQFQTNKKERHKDVKRYVGLPDDWEIDDLLGRCIDTYLYLSQSVSSKILQTAYMSVDKLKEQLEAIDLNERDSNNKPIWNIKHYSDTTKVIPDLLETIQKAEKAYLKGEQENEKLRGNKLKTLYEDGFSSPGAQSRHND